MEMKVLMVVLLVICGLILATMTIWGLLIFSQKQGDIMSLMNGEDENGSEKTNGEHTGKAAE